MPDEHRQWRRRLDSTIDSLAREIRVELYDNVIVPLVRDWFTTSDSIDDLNRQVSTQLNAAWPRVQQKVQTAFTEYENYLREVVATVSRTDTGLDFTDAQREIAKSVTAIANVAVAALAGTLLGGGGIALLLEGPVGWVLGAVLGALVFFLGKNKLHDLLAPQIRKRRIVPFLKRRAKSKVATTLQLNSPKFEEQIRTTLTDAAKDLYRALDALA